MTFKELNRKLIATGWYHDHTNGSHYIYKHYKNFGILVVPHHKGDIPKGTLNKILKQANLK